MSSAPRFDPNIIERYAEQLYRKADSVRIGSAVAGAVLGVVFGAVPVSPLGPYLPIPSSVGMATILVGALVGGFLGYAVGEGRAFRARLQAQMVLFQLQLERNTSGAAPAPAAAPAAPVPAAPLPAAPPVAAPVAPPQPPVIPVLPAQPRAAAAPTVPVARVAPTPVAPPAPPLAPRPPLEAVRAAAEPAPPLLPPLSPSKTA
jgi:hypothetical protein